MKRKNVLQKASHILAKPHEFFEHAKHEKGIIKPLKYITVFILITQVFIVVYYFKNVFAKYGIQLSMTTGNFVVVYIVATAFVLTMSFVRPAITNFFIKMYEGKASFESTYRAMAYGMTPDYIGTPFFLITMVLLSASIFVHSKWLVALFIISALITLVTQVYAVYLRTYGVARLNNITMWQSFMSVYIWPILLLLALELIVIALLGSVLVLT